MGSLLSKLRNEAAATNLKSRSREATQWFIERVRELTGKINRRNLLNDSELKVRPTPMWGNMYMFVYDALHKDTLPYYDRFPLVIMLKPTPDGFMGLNLHYLEPKVRALFLDRLIDTMPNADDDKGTASKRLRIRYSLLQSAQRFRYFKPCLKQYLGSQIKSRIAQVNFKDWDTAIFLPTEHFSGARKTRVWKDSREIYRKP
jgi:hypothetical protein